MRGAPTGGRGKPAAAMTGALMFGGPPPERHPQGGDHVKWLDDRSERLLQELAIEVVSAERVTVYNDAPLELDDSDLYRILWAPTGHLKTQRNGVRPIALRAERLLLVQPGRALQVVGDVAVEADTASTVTARRRWATGDAPFGRNDATPDLFVISFSATLGSVQPELAEHGGLLIGRVGLDPFVRVALTRLVEEMEAGKTVRRSLATSLVRACLAILMDHGEEPDEESVAASVPTWLSALLAYVLSDLKRDYTVASLARQAGRSRSGFAREFKAETGSAPMEFVQKARADKARRLLITTNMAVSDIALESGFGDRSHFSRVFTTIYNVRPSVMRQEGRAMAREAAAANGHPWLAVLPPAADAPSEQIAPR